MRDADAPYLAAPEWTELAECSNDRSDRVVPARDLATPRRRASSWDLAALHAGTSRASSVRARLGIVDVA
jgi:hypothetical protein